MKTPSSRAKLNRQSIEEASAWFVDFRVGDMDAAARDEFSRWLRRSPEHIRAYLEIAETYVELPAKHEPGQLDIEQLIAQARADANVVPLGSAGPRDHSRRVVGVPVESRGRKLDRRGLLAACALLACCVFGWAAWLYGARNPTYATQVGEQRSITLVDGSIVHLNARSKVRVRFSGRTRDVDLLEGQALFVVMKDSARPFVVRTDQTQVRAVGTQFDVYRSARGTTVTVVEGRVAVTSLSSPDAGSAANAGGGGSNVADPIAGTGHAMRERGADSSSILLAAGEQVTVSSERVARPARADLAATTSWMQRRLVFDSSALSQVAEEFNRYNQRRLVIDDAQLADMLISGVYSSTDPASLLRFLRDQPGVSVTETDTEIRVSRK